MRKAQRDASAAGTEIENLLPAAVRNTRKHRIDKRFGIGSRNQHTGADIKRQPVEFPFAEQILQRLMLCAAHCDCLCIGFGCGILENPFRLELRIVNAAVPEHFRQCTVQFRVKLLHDDLSQSK